MDIRTAQDVIDQAIKENRFGEFLLYLFATLFVGVGLSAVVYGMIHENAVTSVVGFASSTLFWPAMSSARRTRKENIAVRLLEAPLGRADTAKDAADMLHRLFDEIFRDKRKDG
jgi:hypothetical protein